MDLHCILALNLRAVRLRSRRLPPASRGDHICFVITASGTDTDIHGTLPFVYMSVYIVQWLYNHMHTLCEYSRPCICKHVLGYEHVQHLLSDLQVSMKIETALKTRVVDTRENWDKLISV